jgi:hypothetical protein
MASFDTKMTCQNVAESIEATACRYKVPEPKKTLVRRLNRSFPPVTTPAADPAQCIEPEAGPDATCQLIDIQ